jgi:hypothetical protein
MNLARPALVDSSLDYGRAYDVVRLDRAIVVQAIARNMPNVLQSMPDRLGRGGAVVAK